MSNTTKCLIAVSIGTAVAILSYYWVFGFEIAATLGCGSHC